MKKGKNKIIHQAIESLEEILKRIDPYIPKSPKAEKKEERQWRLAKDDSVLPSPEHNQVTSPF